MKYPAIKKEEVKEFVRWYEEHPEFTSPLIRYGKTFDEIYENLLNSGLTFKESNLEKVLITYRDNKDLLTDETVAIINKLLGDRKLRNKIRVIFDGSFLTHRIWGTVSNDLKIQFYPGLRIVKDINDIINISSLKNDKLKSKKKIDWMYNHFDTIWIQIMMVTSREDIIDEIAHEKERRYIYDWCDRFQL